MADPNMDLATVVDRLRRNLPVTCSHNTYERARAQIGATRFADEYTAMIQRGELDIDLEGHDPL